MTGPADAPSLTPGRSSELADLRRRAYGPDADIQRDPNALARLHELEELARDQPEDPPAAATESIPSAEGTSASPGGSADRAPTSAVTDAQEAGAEQPAAAAGAVTPRRPWWRRVPVWAVAAVSLIAGVVIAVSAMWFGTQSAPEDGPDLTLASAAGGERGPGFMQSLDYWGVVRGSVKPYESFDTIAVWTARGSEESRCLLLSYEGQIFSGACVGGGLDPVIDMIVHDDMPVAYEQPLPAGSVLRFMATQDGVQVWVRPAGLGLTDLGS